MENLLEDIKSDKKKKLNEYTETFKMNLKDWLDYYQENIHMHNCSYMGVRTRKNPIDAWVYQEIIHEVKPDYIIEIGSLNGGSTLYFANLLDSIGHGKVISVDIQRDYYEVEHERIIEITGDSASPEVLQEIYSICKDKSVLVIQDGEHSKVQVLKDLRAYADLVSQGSYFIVEDTTREFRHQSETSSGPFEAVVAFLKENSDFIVDKERERYLITNNLNGFLKKIGKTNVASHNNFESQERGVRLQMDDMKPYLVPRYHTRLLSNYLNNNIEKVDTQCMEELYCIGFEMYNLFKNVIQYNLGKLHIHGSTAIYGTGDLCEGLISAIQGHNTIKLSAIITSNKHNMKPMLFGLPVISIGEIEKYNIKNIIIGSIASRHEILRRINESVDVKNVSVFTLLDDPIETAKIELPENNDSQTTTYTSPKGGTGDIYAQMVCPVCKKELCLSAFETSAGKVKEGVLSCDSCNKKYPIVNFIPRMVPVNLYRNKQFEKKYGIKESELVTSFNQTEQLVDLQEKTDFYFGQQWEHYSRYGWEEDSSFNYKDSVEAFWIKTLLEKESINGKLILDAGCGNGRYSRVAAENGGRVVAVDIGRNVDVTRDNLKNIGLDVFVVQGDMLNLPFKENVFDTVFTIGVLQHTGDPERAFKSLVHTLKQSGIISIRAYQRGNPLLEENDTRIREITTSFSLDELHEFSGIMYDLAQFLTRKRLLSSLNKYVNLWNRQHNIFDWYAAPVADKLTYDQVKTWFSDEKIRCIKDSDQHIPEKDRSFCTISILGEKTS